MNIWWRSDSPLSITTTLLEYNYYITRKLLQTIYCLASKNGNVVNKNAAKMKETPFKRRLQSIPTQQQMDYVAAAITKVDDFTMGKIPNRNLPLHDVNRDHIQQILNCQSVFPKMTTYVELKELNAELHSDDNLKREFVSFFDDYSFCFVI